MMKGKTIQTTSMNNDRIATTTASYTAGTVATICHAVPCHISYNGPSSGVDIFFNPMEIAPPTGTSSTSTNINNDDTNVAAVSNHQSQKSDTLNSDNDSKVSYQAAMVRGRGLLAHCSNDDTDRVCGHVFQVVDDTPTMMMMAMKNHSQEQQQQQPPQKRLQSIQSFDRYVEWYHEHQTSMIPTTTDPSSTRYHRAIEWMNTANCLHDPLPLPIEPSKTLENKVC